MKVATTTLFALMLILTSGASANEHVNGDTVDAEARSPDPATPIPSAKAILYPTGTFVTGSGTGFEGADVSHLQDRDFGFGTWGFANSRSEDARTADDFLVPEGQLWQIDRITFYAYQTIRPQKLAETSTINHINLRIWDGPPGESLSNVVWGDTQTNRFLSSSWTNAYRVSQYDESLSDRAIMEVICDVGATLSEGTYWLDWQTDGSSSFPGPFAPPITILGQKTTGNGLFFLNGTWREAFDWDWMNNTFQQGFPFRMVGTVFDIAIPAPEELHVRNSDLSTIWFYCQDVSKPALPVNQNAFPTWRHVVWGDDQIEGYHHQVFSGTSCTTSPVTDSVWERTPGSSYYDFQIPSPAEGSYCWQVRAWMINQWSGGSNIFGEWSDCCCFEVGIELDYAISDVTPEIGEVVDFAITGVPGTIDGATWDFGGAGCDGESAAQVCVPSAVDNCMARSFQYATSGSKSVSLSVEYDGATYTAPQKTISVQNVGECPSLAPEPLATPTITSIDDQPCGGSTANTSPYIRWNDVTGENGYRWRLINAAGSLVQTGITGTNVNIAVPDSLDPGSYEAIVQARGDGVDYSDSEWSQRCAFTVQGATEESVDFTWWPEQPKQGEKVRFADRSNPKPQTWSWDLGDGSASLDQHPSHVFESTGQVNVTLEAEFESGFRSIQKTITVSGAVQCGDNVCDGSETAWSCPADCALEPEETGRAGGSDRRPTVPAAAGAVPGQNSTLWNTEGTVYNPGPDTVKVVVEYTPMEQTEIQQAGPFDLPPQRSLYWENIVQEVFNTNGSGALWIDATGPVHVMTRTYTPESSTKDDSGKGTYGQGFSGARERLTLAQDEGVVHLIGLRDDGRFRTNLYFQEVDGSPVKVRVVLFADSGQQMAQKFLSIKGHSVSLKNLGALFSTVINSCYVTVEVVEGEGRIVAAGSVIDEITGDPTSVSAVHAQQVRGKTSGDVHDLVPAVVHTNGVFESVWRSRLTIQNPITNPPQTVRLVFKAEYDRTGAIGDEIETTVTLQPGQQIPANDVLPDLFGVPENVKTQGSLHAYSPYGVIIDSRTYNERSDGGTLGLGMPALREKDLIQNEGKHGLMTGLERTESTRTNVGLAEYSGEDTAVEIVVSTTRSGVFDFGPIIRQVPANSHVQLLRVFDQLPGLEGVSLKGLRIEVTVLNGGSIYAYATVIDNHSGDPTTFLATTD